MNKNWSPEIAKRQRERRAKTNNVVTKRYEKTKNGFLMRAYKNMQSRVKGVQKTKHHLYKNKELWDKETFYLWSKNSKKFHTLFAKWEKSGYARKLTPSTNRIDPKRGYCASNCEWITHSENSRLGAISKQT